MREGLVSLDRALERRLTWTAGTAQAAAKGTFSLLKSFSREQKELSV